MLPLQAPNLARAEAAAEGEHGRDVREDPFRPRSRGREELLLILIRQRLAHRSGSRSVPEGRCAGECAEVRALIGELYAIERLVPGPVPGDASAQRLRQQLRKERSRPILVRIWQWATVQVGPPRSDFGKAVRYMLNRWAGLTRVVEDPRIPLDNNAAERALRGPVVGRKNHSGSRSLRGTEVAAVFYTLCETARLVGVDPRAYLPRAVYAAIGRPGTVTFPEDLLASTLTG